MGKSTAVAVAEFVAVFGKAGHIYLLLREDVRQPFGYGGNNLNFHHALLLMKKILPIGAIAQLQIIAAGDDSVVKGYAEVLVIFIKQGNSLLA